MPPDHPVPMPPASKVRNLSSIAAGAIGALAVLASSAHAQVAVRNQGYIPFSEPPINYRSDDLHDPVARLQQQLDQGKASLEYDADHGYLKSVLKLLNVPDDSQTLVFSKTSFQYPKISPEHPRALYFNDDVYVGSVHEGKAVEIVSFDPRQGAIFYLLDERKSEHPAFQRAELDCTQCHIAAGTRGIPGVFLRSVFPTASGTLAPGAKSFITDQDSPLAERWGGWYITNVPGNRAHLGNAVVSDKPSGADGDPMPTPAPEMTPFGKPFDASAYVAPSSDVVAHLVLAHQTQMHNLITLTNYKTRMALYSLSKTSAAASASGEPAAGQSASITEVPASVRQQYEVPAEQLLRYLLFATETPLDGLDGARLAQSSAFAQHFATHGIRDPKGRSLRDFDLNTRIFKYPCSYLVYSDAFDALPEPAKGYVYHRLLQVLSGQDQTPDFAKVSDRDRRAILEILLATKPGLPDEWKGYARANRLQVAEVRARPAA
jgi:hypothetical protein